MNWRRSSILRKAAALAYVPGRRLRAWRASEADYRLSPPVIANSFPKSGTHLLMQVLAAWPGVRRSDEVLASMPSVTFRERSAATMAKKIGQLAPGDLVAGHLHAHPLCADAIKRKHAVHYFIYRDLRDVAVSEAHYLTHMNRWHRLHRIYKRLDHDEARIAFAIAGCTDRARRMIGHEGCVNACKSLDYPDIGGRFARFEPWLSDPRVCAVRFEDLVGPDRRNVIGRMVDHYNRAVAGEPASTAAREQMIDAATAAIDPARSHTFRAGKVGGHREVFSDAHHALMEQVAGDLLVRLGYEQREPVEAC